MVGMRMLALAGALGLAGAEAMGGWAVISVENPPEVLEAGATYQLEYTVRGHGEAPLGRLSGQVRIKPAEGPAFEVAAAPAGRTGRYRASFRVPASDHVVLTVASGFGPPGYSTLTLVPVPVIRPGTVRPVASPTDRGRALFVAKGCGTCHINNDVPEWAAANEASRNLAPDLTGRKLASDYVRQRLTNPRSLPNIGSGPVRMPDLGLAPAEVDALVALLSGSDQRASR